MVAPFVTAAHVPTILLVLQLVCKTVIALPSHQGLVAYHHEHAAIQHTHGSYHEVSLATRGLADEVQLRILPLGASIVYGLKSSDGNGFRYPLRNQLVNGNPVNMIGSVHAGTMADNDCEGWPGYVITQVAEKAELSIPSQPNLVLLHVGTNDAVQSVDIQNAATCLGTLIDRLFDAIPGVTIIASTLLPNANANTQANIDIYHSQIPDTIRTRQEAKQKITYVDFSSPYFSVSDLGDDG